MGDVIKRIRTDNEGRIIVSLNVETPADMPDARVIIAIPCPEHGISGGGVCPFCGTRGAGPAGQARVWGFQILEGSDAPRNGRIECTLQIQKDSHVPLGSGGEYMKFHTTTGPADTRQVRVSGEWLNVMNNGGILVVQDKRTGQTKIF